MKPAKHYVPEGLRAVTPYLMVRGGAKLIDFLKQTFGAETIVLHQDPGGKVMHAQVRIGDSMLQISDASAPWEPTPAALHVYVPDVDATYKKAIAAGATSLHEVMDMFYGERSGGVKDAWGNSWWIATFKEELTKDEIDQRAAAAGKR